MQASQSVNLFILKCWIQAATTDGVGDAIILNHQNIIEAHRDGAVWFEPFDPEHVRAASIDLCVGPYGASTGGLAVVDLDQTGQLTLQPGDAGLISSMEIVHFDNSHTGRIGICSKHVRQGLSVTTGLQVDPGFHGRLFIGIMNLTPQPITLEYREPLISIEICRLSSPTDRPYQGLYQGKVTLESHDIEHMLEVRTYALSDIHDALAKLNEQLVQSREQSASLQEQMGQMTKKMQLFQYISLAGWLTLGAAVLIF